MRQFVGSVRDDSTVRDLLVSVAPAARCAPPPRRSSRPSCAMMEQRRREDPDALRAGAGRLGRRRRLRRRGALGHLHGRGARRARSSRRSGARCARSPAASRSGWCSRRCCAGPTRCCCSTSRTTTSTCPASAGWRRRCASRPRRCCSFSHDRELLARTATRIVTVELGAGGNTAWTHGGGFATYHEARRDRFARLEELRRRWDEEHAKLQGAGPDVQAEGRLQRRDGLALPGRA